MGSEWPRLVAYEIPEECELELPENWELCQIETLYEQLPIGKRFEKKKTSETGSTPVIDQSAEGVIGWHDEEPGVDASLDKPVVTFANHTCEMRWMTHPFSVIQNVFPLAGRDGVCDTRFLYYGTKGRVHLEEYKGHFPDYRRKWIPVPPLPEQRSIVHILGTLDDRIELNRRMNETLEAMAQALFKSWFVDFDPVIDKALAAAHPIPEPLQKHAEARKALGNQRKPLPTSIAQHFPDRFVFNEEMGWIPEGWELKTLSDHAEKITKGTTPTKRQLAAATDEPEIPFIKVKDLDNFGNIGIDELATIPRSVHERALRRSRLKQGDVLFSIAGTIGRSAVVPVVLDESNTNQAVAFVRPKTGDMTHFIHQLLKSQEIQNLVTSRVVQAVQANFSLTELAGIPLLDPGGSLLGIWHQQTESVAGKIPALTEISRSLARLRDALLPKLLSGELRLSAASLEELATQAGIPEAEKLMEEAL